MPTPMFDLVKTLTELPGPMGQEELVHEWCANHWSTVAEHVEITRVGNVVARVGGDGPSLLVLAHGDELTLMVKSVTDNGLLRVWPAWPDRKGRPPHWYNPINQPVVVLSDTGPQDGQLCYASGHVIGGETAREHFVWDDWFVDLGYSSREKVTGLGIHPGTRITINPGTRRLGDTIVGKAMDNRAAIAIATSVAERADTSRLQHELWVGSSIQEENGLIGASSFPDIHPFDFGVALDVGLCGDVPGTSSGNHPAVLGGGPLIVHQDSSTHYSHRMTMRFVETAAAEGIPVQQAVFQNYGSDGAALIRRGVETVLLTFPTRYTHSPNEMVTETELVQCVDLILAYLYREPLPARWPK
ncbi:MAG: aminopeptidase [Chloroflexi bacterium]|nr:MAG: aminopeptidase [Chloroflexota bacterium]